ncbi:hypothetical protein CEXT_675481 [Caerostris extrusa]|uniref:Uncharacterized protein n=1 Tax=Caerostris extrusa TaxID=172846 RepID=A0AAV4XC30_CAEEX|nr:hypothetical protein CEXT_675481 [Caerostris extrusa]
MGMIMNSSVVHMQTCGYEKWNLPGKKEGACFHLNLSTAPYSPKAHAASSDQDQGLREKRFEKSHSLLITTLFCARRRWKPDMLLSKEFLLMRASHAASARDRTNSVDCAFFRGCILLILLTRLYSSATCGRMGF